MSTGETEGPAVAIAMKGYPRLSETFIAQELLGLQRLGLSFAIWSLRHPTDGARHLMHKEITAPLHYLRGRFRERLLLKAEREVDVPAALREWMAKTKLPSGVKRTVDIDPYSFL